MRLPVFSLELFLFRLFRCYSLAVAFLLITMENAVLGQDREEPPAAAPVIDNRGLFDTFYDRSDWEIAAGLFVEETFETVRSDRTFNNGRTVDMGNFTLTGFGDATLWGESHNRIVAGNSQRSTKLAVRVCEAGMGCGSGLYCHIGFDIQFAEPQIGWGASFGRTGSSFQVSADGNVVGTPRNYRETGFFGFFLGDDNNEPFSTIRIDTEPIRIWTTLSLSRQHPRVPHLAPPPPPSHLWPLRICPVMCPF